MGRNRENASCSVMPGSMPSSSRRIDSEPWVAANSKQAIWSASLTRRRPEPGRTKIADALTGSQPSSRSSAAR